MSELKAFTFGLGQYTEDGSPCVVAFDGEKNPRLASDEKFYIKSEADKVIARQKKKRCLAMAKLCHWKMGVFIYKEEKNEFYYRWYKRWLKLADKLKEAK